MSGTGGTISEQLVGPAALAVAGELGAVYESAFGTPEYGGKDAEAARVFATEQLPLHAGRDGFKLVVTRAGRQITGFAYGFTGQRGQWWTDRIVELAPAEIVEEWVGGHFEVVDLAVAVPAQGQGFGSTLHDHLMADLPHSKALLTTHLGDTLASQLYQRRGWRLLMPDLGTGSALYGLDLKA